MNDVHSVRFWDTQASAARQDRANIEELNVYLNQLNEAYAWGLQKLHSGTSLAEVCCLLRLKYRSAWYAFNRSDYLPE